MDDILRLFGRLVVIAFGFVAACYTASLVLVFSAEGWAVDFTTYSGWDVEGGLLATGDGTVGVFAALFLATFATSFIGAMALVPAGLAIVLAEVKHIRGLIYHLVAGGLVSLAIVVATWIPPAPDVRLPADWNIFLAAGFAAGFVYWLIAGRKSGF
ncbi:hypothetical protein [Breoghania sp. L-A4]|uniref:hypothetical protein n=1 Tax=Breoghania sp. L-A4 TaxID=2304600 RepID=UPI000E359109|nr:hypothetical protein [Breoghania sp. L-A4]AXS42268.1 hypothetical protein D1F64_22610 [Breoghania sp. L-A4]